MQSIQNLSLLRWVGRGYFPTSHLSPENSWPCPRWPLASPGHKSCNPARTVRGLSRNFSFFDPKISQMLPLSTLSSCQRPFCHVKSIVTQLNKVTVSTRAEKVDKRCKRYQRFFLSSSHVEQRTSPRALQMFRRWNIKQQALKCCIDLSVKEREIDIVLRAMTLVGPVAEREICIILIAFRTRNWPFAINGNVPIMWLL